MAVTTPSWLRRTAMAHGTLTAMLGLAIAWQSASLFFPKFLFPGLDAIALRLFDLFGEHGNLIDAAATACRILAGLGGAFLAGTPLAGAKMRAPLFERYPYPLLNFNQRIPPLSRALLSPISFNPIHFPLLSIT